MLLEARNDPDRLVIGIDADAASMRAAARRASRSGLASAAFVVSAVESLPEDLSGVADRVTISFPWGSLLRGLVGGEEGTIEAVARLCRPSGVITSLWSLTARDAAVGSPVDPDLLVCRWERAGLEVLDLRIATAEEVAAAHSSWARRLRVGHERTATILRAGKG